MDDDISIDIAPDKSLVQKFGLVGYRVEQAMAELLDNSIDARIGDAEGELRCILISRGRLQPPTTIRTRVKVLQRCKNVSDA